jgi:hypothetical protein
MPKKKVFEGSTAFVPLRETVEAFGVKKKGRVRVRSPFYHFEGTYDKFRKQIYRKLRKLGDKYYKDMDSPGWRLMLEIDFTVYDDGSVDIDIE